jgi:ribosomal protein S6
MSFLNAKIDENTSILVETNSSAGKFVDVGLKNIAVPIAADALKNAIHMLVKIGNNFAEEIARSEGNLPSQLELQYGIKISAEGNVWLAKISGEGQITAKLYWNKPSQPNVNGTP